MSHWHRSDATSLLLPVSKWVFCMYTRTQKVYLLYTLSVQAFLLCAIRLQELVYIYTYIYIYIYTYKYIYTYIYIFLLCALRLPDPMNHVISLRASLADLPFRGWYLIGTKYFRLMRLIWRKWKSQMGWVIKPVLHNLVPRIRFWIWSSYSGEDFKYLYRTISRTLFWNLFPNKGKYIVDWVVWIQVNVGSYIHIYIYIYICFYMYVYIYIYIYINILRRYICIYICMIYTYICI